MSRVTFGIAEVNIMSLVTVMNTESVMAVLDSAGVTSHSVGTVLVLWGI